MTSSSETRRLQVPKSHAKFYHRELARLFGFLIPQNARVLDVGCGSGDLLSTLKPTYGLGIDTSADTITYAKEQHGDTKGLSFRQDDIENPAWGDEQPFDYVILSDIMGHMRDVQQTLKNVRKVCAPHTRILLNYHSNLWRPALVLASMLGLRRKSEDYNWLSTSDVKNLLYLAGFEVVTMSGRVIMPVYVPLLSALFNRVVSKFFPFSQMCLTYCIIARPTAGAAQTEEKPSVSILVPTRNEMGNMEPLFERTEQLGGKTELVFVDGNSDDGTVEEIERCAEKYKAKWPDVSIHHQTGKGKGQAVRQGFEECAGDILMILDSDLTMPPEELPKYYEAIVSGRGDFINGCRLVYPQEDEAMRFLNMLANHTFAHLFSWLLSQTIKDTLCGTKVLWHADYLKIAANRSYFGDFDPFGDFDLLFGASKLNLKIIDIPVRYRERTYGEIKINRWRDGMLLLRMSMIAFLRLKLS